MIPMKYLKYIPAAAFAATLVLTSCGGKKKEEEAEKPLEDQTALKEQWYKDNTEFFVFAKPEDLPTDLPWENGMDLPELGSPNAKKGGELNGGMADYPRTFRHLGPDANHSFRFYLLDLDVQFTYRHPNEEGYFPGIVNEWAIVPDERTVYLKIDPDARWSDGEPITADDVMFSFYFRQSKDNQAPFYNNFYLEQYEKVTKYDDRTFAITVAQKKPDFYKYALELTTEPEHFYQGFGPGFPQTYQWRVRPTAGAYSIDESSIKKGRSLSLNKVPNWWAADKKYFKHRYNFDRINLTVVRDPEKSFETFKKGEFDIARLNLAAYWYEKLGNDNPLVADGYIHKANFFNDIPQAGLGLWLNSTKPLLDNIDIRKGIAHASNWELVIDKFFRGMWAKENSTSTGFGELTHPTLKSREFSVEKAGEHFAKAGFKKRGPDGILVNDAGKKLSFTVSTGSKTLGDVLTILQQEARKAGLEFKIEILDSTAGWKKVQEKKHEIQLTGFSFSVTEIYPEYWQCWHGDNARNDDGSIKVQTNNYTLINDPELNEKIIRYRTSESHEEKVKLAHELEEMIHESAVYVYGVYLPSYRTGYWRWIQWPEGFHVKRSELARDFMLHWVDEDVKKETLEAMKAKKKFPAVVKDYDQYKPE